MLKVLSHPRDKSPTIMSHTIVFKNSRGINDPDKQCPFFTQWLTTNQPIAGVILESHIKEPNLNHFIHKICPCWNHTSNHSSDEDGENNNDM